MANLGLAVSDIVNVTVTISPLAAGFRNFGSLLIMGSSTVIDVTERLRPYSSIGGVASDFGTTAPEYLAAQSFFSQSPQPSFLYVGKWAQAATAAVLHGAALTPTQQALTNFTSISNGSMTVTIDGTVKTLSAVNLTSATSLNNIAATLQTALGGAITCVWDSNYGRFNITSGTTGATSTITYGGPTGSGTDLSGILGFTAAAGAAAPVQGIVAETALSAVNTLANMSNDWYGLMFATSTPPSTSDHIAIAAAIEAQGTSRIYGVTITNTSVLDGTITNDLASQLQSLTYKRTFSQYSGSSPYAVASIFGRAFTVDFTAQNTTITVKFKQEPGVSAELITESQAAALKAKNCNVFVKYNNKTSIIQEGVMANGYFFDEVHGLDWFQNALQTNLYNVLYQATTKVPQTDAGTHLLVVSAEKTCISAVNNGLVAPGVWNAAVGFGSLNPGDTMTKGWYVFAPLVATQAQADREARKSVPIQIALKLAGAIHSVNALVTVNR